MTSNAVNVEEPVIGFVTVEHVPELGHCGGLLLLNVIGRPVEFHCTAPVPENRAQRILYGRTYQTFLYCDQISLALVGKAKKSLALIVTDRSEILPLGRLSAAPVLCISDPHEQDTTVCDPDTTMLESGGLKLWTVESDIERIEPSVENCRRFTKSLPLDEPFERIRQAITEAQTVSK